MADRYFQRSEVRKPLVEQKRISDDSNVVQEPEIVTPALEKDTSTVETGAEVEAVPSTAVEVSPERAGEAEEEEEVIPVGAEEAEAVTEEAAAEDAIAAMIKELAAARQEADEYKDKWMRAAAEFANVRKRNERMMAEAIANANARLIQQLLPIVDDFELAFQNVPDDLEEAEAKWVEGFRLIQRKLEQLLAAEGVTPIEAEGQHFDPFLHEAIAHEEAEDYEDGQIIAEVRKGYRLGERVLRPALVRVAK